MNVADWCIRNGVEVGDARRDKDSSWSGGGGGVVAGCGWCYLETLDGNCDVRLTCGVRSMLLEICGWFTLFAAVIFVVCVMYSCQYLIRQGLIQRHRFTARVFTSFQLCRTNGDFVCSSLHMFGRRTSLNVGRAQTQLVSLALPLPFTVVIP